MIDDIKTARENQGTLASKRQISASNPEHSVWVEASAGTGKTKVLSDRVLRLLLTGVSPNKILCLTYTKAAAVEMSSRIAKRLSRFAILDEETLHHELLGLLGELPNSHQELSKIFGLARKLFAQILDVSGGMKIQTIHSFCQEILKRFPLEAKISPYFEVMDERTSNEALLEIRNALIENIENNRSSKIYQAFDYLVKNITENNFSSIIGSITSNRNKISKMFDNYKNIDEILEDLSKNLSINPLENEESLIVDFFKNIDEQTSKKIMNAWLNSTSTDIVNGNILANILSSFERIEFYEVYKSLFFTKDKNEPKKCSRGKAAVCFYPDLAEVFAREQDRVFELENKLASMKVFASTKAVLYLADELISGYKNYKKKHSKMDYEDLIVLTKDLLAKAEVSDWVLFKLDGGIDHILLDEAQDTSPNQWNIIRSVSSDFFSGEGAREQNRTIFVVGDRKQSIYSFQGASPKEFEDNRKYYTNTAKNFKNVRLDVSFRSTSLVLELVNSVFKDEIASKGVVLEGEETHHIPFRLGDSGRVEVWPVKGVPKPEDLKIWEKPITRVSKETSSSNLAKEIAEYIKNLVQEKVMLKSQNRPVRFKDFLILVRKRGSFVEELIRECKAFDVAIAGADEIKLLEQIAIKDLISLGKFLLLPNDDLSLAEVLKSPIFGLDDDDLFDLCYKRKPYSLWQMLIKNEKYADIVSKLGALLNMVDFHRPFEIYSYVLNKLEGRKKFVERMGQEVVDGLDEFINLTFSFEIEHIPTFQNFISWIMQDEVKIKREQEQGDVDVVRVMTVHGSKGLQAPIVILPDSASVPKTDRKSTMLWGDDGLFYYPLGAKDYDGICTKIHENEKVLTFNEYRRLLYVALTRAEDRLCICGYENSGKIHDDSWYNLVQRKFAEIGITREDGKIIYETEQRFFDEKKAPKEAVIKNKKLDFAWINQIAPVEGPLAKPYTPSIGDEEERQKVALFSPLGSRGENRYQRGLIIHKLLQFLPKVLPSIRQEMIEIFLEKNANDLNGYQKNRIILEVSNLFLDEKFAILFGENSREEVSIMGEVEGKIVSAQLDRIVILEDRVLIVDFKTNRPAAENIKDVPRVYIKQLETYKKLLEKIYPNKKIESYILWTDIAKLLYLP